MADETFERADAGASLTHPEQASALRKNGFVLLKGEPCKIVDMSTSKTGKHGHAKVHIVGLQIFNNKKYEDLCPSTHNMSVPEVSRKDFTMVDLDDDFVSMMDDDGDIKSDLKLPEDAELQKDIRDGFAAGKELVLTVLSAMGKEQIIQARETNAK
eukprot:TRINITY_DN4305_c0_g1_i1.p1 TRINITY_DN4305_c0_g1~~TRINITY_DN4305_c0_g1_i1.p1  ORF type:complete len:156 (-),score=44.73 TRINITY_DN4305_c0_g1_i1:80-547(-)